MSNLADRDLQMTLRFQDGTEQTFTVIRDRGMRWKGTGTAAPLVAIEAEWFDNPIRLAKGKPDDDR